MIDELIGQVVEKFGLPEDQAQEIVKMILGFLKDKVPGIGGTMDAILGGKGMDDIAKAVPGAGGLAGLLGGLFGKK